MIKKYSWLLWFFSLLALIVYFFREDTISATIAVFLSSLLFFHLILFRFAKHEKIWKSTDYIFELVAIISLIAAVSGLSAASKQKTLQQEFAKRKLAQVKLIYAVELSITNDCNPKESRSDIWTVTPEPIQGECERIESFLPQMKFQFDQETGPENMTAETDWGANLVYDNVALDGTWSMIHTRAKEFLAVNKGTEEAIQLREELKKTLKFDIAKIDKIVYWYHVLGFFLALKIARISMSIFKK
jgi:hypothetical protein